MLGRFRLHRSVFCACRRLILVSTLLLLELYLSCACCPEVTVTSSSPAPFVSPCGIFNTNQRSLSRARRYLVIPTTQGAQGRGRPRAWLSQVILHPDSGIGGSPFRRAERAVAALNATTPGPHTGMRPRVRDVCDRAAMWTHACGPRPRGSRVLAPRSHVQDLFCALSARSGQFLEPCVHSFTTH